MGLATLLGGITVRMLREVPPKRITCSASELVTTEPADALSISRASGARRATILSRAYDAIEASVFAEFALYDCPEAHMHEILSVLRAGGFSSSESLHRPTSMDPPRMTIRRRYYAEEFHFRTPFFTRLAELGVVGRFWNGAEYLYAPSIVYLAAGKWRRLPSETLRAVPLVSVTMVEAAMESASFEAIATLDEAMGGDTRRIVELAAAACGDAEVGVGHLEASESQHWPAGIDFET